MYFLGKDTLGLGEDISHNMGLLRVLLGRVILPCKRGNEWLLEGVNQLLQYRGAILMPQLPVRLRLGPLDRDRQRHGTALDRDP